MARLSFGIKTAPQHLSYDEMLRTWQEADSIPSIEHAWLFDHYAPIAGSLDGPCFEGWTLLAAVTPVVLVASAALAWLNRKFVEPIRNRVRSLYGPYRPVASAAAPSETLPSLGAAAETSAN